MKTLYFCQHFSTPAGSTGSRAYEMAQRLLKRGHQVTLVCGSYQGANTGLTHPFVKGKRRGLVEGMDVVELDLAYANQDGFLKRSFTFLKFVVRSTKFVFTEQYDVVFASSTPLTVAIPGIIARWFKRKPFVFEVRDLWPELPKAMGVIKNPLILFGLTILERISYWSAHELIGLSPGMVEGMVRCGVPRSRVHLIPNGCDFNLFEDLPPASRPCGLQETDFVAIYTGTHGMANGLDAVIDAAVILKKRGRKDIKLVLIGQGKLKPCLQRRVKNEELDNVIFLDPIPKLELAQFMLNADLGLQVLANVPAFYDGTSPNKFFDYLAAGLPVLINYPGWLAKKVDEMQCGFVVPPNDARAFADALEKASQDLKSLRVMNSNATQLAKKEFDRNQLAERWVNILEKAVRLEHTAVEVIE